MSSLFQTLFLFSFSLLLAVVAVETTTKPRPQGLLLPVTKDRRTNQYYTSLHLGTPRRQFNLVLDLGSQETWTYCGGGYNTSSSTFRTAHCDSAVCHATVGPGCIGETQTCLQGQYNPFARWVLQGPLGVDRVSLRSTDGASVSARRFAFICAGEEEFEGVLTAAQGSLGLARSKLSFYAQIASAFNLPPKFALCLSPSASTGALFVGGADYHAPPYPESLTHLFTITPLNTNPISTTPIYTISGPSDDYFISVNSIAVDSKPLPFNQKLLSINKDGFGGTKLSTVDPYTVLHSDVYRALVKEFLKSAKAMGLQLVHPFAPFQYCFDSKSVERDGTVPKVPVIDLVVPGKMNDGKWRIYGANSMVEVNGLVMCLGFIDGGEKVQTSIVIGAHQMENHLLEFDLTRTTIGISGSLLLENTSCSNFGVSV